MTTPHLTFTDKHVENASLLGPDGATHYTAHTLSGSLHRRQLTTVTVTATGLVGIINWGEKTFEVNGVARSWNDVCLEPRQIMSDGKTWRWSTNSYTFKRNTFQRELLVTSPSVAPGAETIIARFTSPQVHLLTKNTPASFQFLHPLHDQVEEMFILLVVIQTQVKRRDAAAMAAV
ncbi:hypothetical protein C8F01DRAFT_1121988 [Mycena amicta]|nr:hypothetical protein C8F01DRAFT_1156234 [Mycena amicta]KAJ7066015.1 hypothetical protein C8F01DRAFT_1121988 [Mycena amicta]